LLKKKPPDGVAFLLLIVGGASAAVDMDLLPTAVLALPDEVLRSASS
jgi:hypothetical protein